jgi:hypothetical protein
MSLPGRLLLHLWHTPANRICDSIRSGGPIAQWRTELARREMEEAAAGLPELPEFQGASPVALHVMTGRKFWYQTVFCLHSLSQAAQATVRADLYDDGTVDAECARLLARMGPRVRLHPAGEAMAKLEEFLPVSRFPVLRERWLHYPNLRKMTDIHLGQAGWKLVIDSDLLFFRRPDALLEWCAHPGHSLHAVDCQESYGYSRALMERLAGAPIPPLINVGLCGLRSEALDWPELESWCAELIALEKTNYYLEQALIAMLMAREAGRVVVPAADYVTKPGKAEARSPRAVMHHYVAESKRWYFCDAWRLIPDADKHRLIH